MGRLGRKTRRRFFPNPETRPLREFVRERRKQRKRQLLDLLGGKCVDCGYHAHPAALDFDHRVPADKKFNMGPRLVQGRWDELVAEALKCEIRCANCHRIKTAARE